MPDGNHKRHILLVEDDDAHRYWYNEEFRTLESKYNIRISVTDAASFKEVLKLMASVGADREKFDCAVIDMRIPGDEQDTANIHWGVQAFKEIQKILELERILIVTAFKGDVVPHLSEAEKRRVRTKDIHFQVFQDDVARMLGLMQTP